MKVLHTSDWHVGKLIRGRSRADEHRAVLDEIVPGMLLQKLVLLGALAGGGLGILRLAPRDSLTGQLVAVSVYQWNPFVAERLVLGHWPLLVGYAVLPWLVLAAREWRTTGVLPWRLW